jgi:hypothetical protein
MQMDWTTLSAIGAAAAGILAAVWKQLSGTIKSFYNELKADITKCQADRETLHNKVGEMEVDLAHLKGCPSEPCGAKEAIRRAASFSIRGNER